MDSTRNFPKAALDPTDLLILECLQADASQAVAAIAEVPMPEMDPVHGREGPLMTLWKGALR